MFPLIEATKMALSAIWNHKLRSALTLVGIIAGVASIIAVMTSISVVQNAIEQELSVLGTTVFQVQKWGRGFEDNDWREIQKRKPVTVEQANAIRERVKNVTMVGAELWDFGHAVRYRKEIVERATLCGGTPEYAENNTHYVYMGRNISNEDLRLARNVVVIGYNIAEQLFPFVDPIDKVVKIDGFKYRVIGVFEEKKTAMGGGYDNYILMPITKYTKIYGLKDNFGNDRSVNVTVRVATPEQVADAIEETRFVLRQIRNVAPQQKDDFTIFTNDSNIRSFNEVTAGVKAGAFVVGIVALIVAGIGIMNIMLVSVTERTKEIGIRKALGARRKHILLQFLLEAVILCNVGGIFGVAVGFALGNLVSVFTGFPATVPMEWAVGGLLFCTSTGLIFGMWPAVLASRLDPIVALRYE
jgi:putative ABC transport system permease protein